MHLPIKLVCRTGNVLVDGTCAVYVQYCCDARNKPLYGTGVKVPPVYWNKKQQCVSAQLPPGYGNYNELNESLLRLKQDVADLVTYATLKKTKDRQGVVLKWWCRPAFGECCNG